MRRGLSQTSSKGPLLVAGGLWSVAGGFTPHYSGFEILSGLGNWVLRHLLSLDAPTNEASKEWFGRGRTSDLTPLAICGTYLCMRTTIDMPDGLMKQAKQVAAERHTTLKVLMIDALERSLNEKPKSFRLRNASVGSTEQKPVASKAINQAIDDLRDGPFQP
jgi:hypothetical protein